MKTRESVVYKARGILVAFPCLLFLVITFKETEFDSIVWPVGLSLFFAGVSLRVWAQQHIHYRLRVKKALTVTGPYKYVRNPIYLGNSAMLTGMTVLSELLWFLPLTLLWCAFVYGLVVQREERHLLEKYGAPYRRYGENVPRWIPRLRTRTVTNGASDTKRFFWPSVVAELHCLLWILPLIAKELLAGNGSLP